MRPPTNYDALRQAEQEAQEARDTPKPTRPTNHPGTTAKFGDDGRPVLPMDTRMDRPAESNPAEIARAAKEREDAAARAKEQDKGQGR